MYIFLSVLIIVSLSTFTISTTDVVAVNIEEYHCFHFLTVSDMPMKEKIVLYILIFNYVQKVIL